MAKPMSKNVNSVKRYGVWLLILVAAYWLTRLVNLTSIPIFTDEAIYLRWAQIALSDPRWRFISLIDGKQPLLIWLFLPALKFIPGDPLILGRLVSVLAGFVGMIGLVTIGFYFTRSIKGALIAGFLYIVIPFFLVYDRLAIYDALFTAIAIWTYFLLYLHGKTLRLDVALISGMGVGAGLLTKSYAYFFLLLLPLTLLVVPWNRKNWQVTLVRWLGLSLLIVALAYVYTSILYLSEFRHVIQEKNLQFIYSFSEFLEHPFRNFWGIVIGLLSWLTSYLTLPVIVVIVIAFLWYFKREKRLTLFWLGWFVGPFIALSFFGKVIYPRFILFMVPPLFVPLSLWIYQLIQKSGNKPLLIGLLSLVILPAVYFDIKLLTDPIHAPLPPADRQQFINDWPAGFGIKEVVAYLKQEAEQGPIVVGTDGTFGLYPMALELYLGTNPNVTFKPYFPLYEFPEELAEYAKERPTFLLFKEKQEAPRDWPITLIAQYQRGDGPTYLKFFRVLPRS